MGEALGGAGHVGAGLGGRQRRFGRAEREIAAHAGGEVEHHVDAESADVLDDLGVEIGVARGLAGGGVADVDMGDGGAGLGGFDGGLRRSPSG